MSTNVDIPCQTHPNFRIYVRKSGWVDLSADALHERHAQGVLGGEDIYMSLQVVSNYSGFHWSMVHSLTRLYTAEEIAAREILFTWFDITKLKEEIGAWQESRSLLYYYLSDEACDHMLDHPEYYELEHSFQDMSDQDIALLPGITEKDILDARLSRNALEILLEFIASRIAHPCESLDGDYLYEIFPYSAKSLDEADFRENAVTATFNVRARLNSGVQHPALSTGEQIILAFALTVHSDLLEDIAAEISTSCLEENLLPNTDFTYLFDRRLDGIENSDFAASKGMRITGPSEWFIPFAIGPSA